MRAELKRLGAIKETDVTTLVPHRRAVVPKDAESRILEGFVFGLAPLADTIEFNAKSATNSRFQRVVHSERIDASRVEELSEVVFDSLVEFSEKLDSKLSPYELAAGSKPEAKADLGVGLYFFVRNETAK